MINNTTSTTFQNSIETTLEILLGFQLVFSVLGMFLLIAMITFIIAIIDFTVTKTKQEKQKHKSNL